MVLSGEKKEEYREIKPYYISRFASLYGGLWINDICYDYLKKDKPMEIMFRNGYSKNSPSFVAKCALSIGAGKEKWGAEKGKEYFILTIKEII